MLRYLLPSLPVLNSKRSYSPDTQPSEQEESDGEQNETPNIQGEMVNELLCHTDTQKSMGQDGIRPRVLKELADVLVQPLCIIHLQSWLTGEVQLTGS